MWPHVSDEMCYVGVGMWPHVSDEMCPHHREPCNISKNRYKDVICYDDNRVILEGSEVGQAKLVACLLMADLF